MEKSLDQSAGRSFEILLWASLAALVVTLSLQRVFSFDYWWALRTGKLILETGAVPTIDPYSFTALGSRWIDIHWIHQIGMYATYLVGGHNGIVIAKLLFVAAVVGLLLTIEYRRDRPIISVAALALMVLMACNRFMARPELPSFLFFAAVLVLLHRFSRTGNRWVYAIVGIQLVWANVHGLFALGIAACGIYGAGEILRRWTSPEKEFRIDRLIHLTAVTALSILVSFLNPNFIDGALYPIQQLGMIGAGQSKDAFGVMIVELLPLFDPIMKPPTAVMAIVVTTSALSLGAMLLNWRRIEASDPLLWAAFIYLTLSAHRNRALLGIVAAAIIMRNVQSYLDRNPIPVGVHRILALLVSVVLLGLAGDVYVDKFYRRTGSLQETGLGLKKLHYPEGAVDWIAQQKPPGPIAHDMSDGGYLIWRLYPEYSVMSDGRLEVYGAEKFSKLQDMSPENFALLDAEYQFGTVLLHYSFVSSNRIIEGLTFDPEWELTYVDDVAAVFVRIPRFSAPLYPELDLSAPGLFPALRGEEDPYDVQRRVTRANFFYGSHRVDRALELWEESIARYPHMRGRYTTYATFLEASGRIQEAERILQEWIRLDPKSAERHAYIADHFRNYGQPRLARTHYDIAIRLDPDHYQSLMVRGFLYEEEKQYDKAIDLYERIVDRLHPAVPIAKQAAGRIELLRTSR